MPPRVRTRGEQGAIRIPPTSRSPLAPFRADRVGHRRRFIGERPASAGGIRLTSKLPNRAARAARAADSGSISTAMSAYHAPGYRDNDEFICAATIRRTAPPVIIAAMPGIPKACAWPNAPPFIACLCDDDARRAGREARIDPIAAGSTIAAGRSPPTDAASYWAGLTGQKSVRIDLGAPRARARRRSSQPPAFSPRTRRRSADGACGAEGGQADLTRRRCRQS